MQHQTVPQRKTKVSHLLGDPAQVALIRDLIVHARKIGAAHVSYSIGDGTDRAYGPQEHTWSAGPARLSIEGRHLRYSRHGVAILTATVVDARDVGQLLAAIGALPVKFSSAYWVGMRDAAVAR